MCRSVASAAKAPSRWRVMLSALANPPAATILTELPATIFARCNWPHTSAIGQRLWDGSEEGKDAEAFTVVGVVGGVKQAGLTEDEAQGAVYYPYAFRIGDSFFVAIRTSLPPESLGLA